MQSREAVAELWLRRVLRDYPPQAAQFMAAEKDPFHNPAGHTLQSALAVLLDELLAGMDRGRITPALDSMMQLKAVQDLAPSSALRFLFDLKEILRIHCRDADFAQLSARIDEMALQAFDLFVQYRERTSQARANEVRRRVFVLERRMNREDRMAWQERGGN
ncbi:MAG TPA: RsbRD N-terminal domain-containing protein [Bryobacteraceae bacterium]|nr:RsbRD N-terminal domain-containing protein [Bryobacteraceae bacterium]